MIASRPAQRGLTPMEKSAAAVLTAGLFFALETLDGSGLAFSALVAAFVGLTFATIAASGGILTLPGILVFFYSFQHIVASQLLKFFYGEQPDARLDVPIASMEVQILGMLGMMVGILLVRRVRKKGRPFFPPVTDIVQLNRIALAGSLLAITRQAVVILSGSAVSEAAGTAVGPIKQLSVIDSISFAAAVAVAVIESDGKRLVNKFVLIVVLPQLMIGFLTGGRFGTIAPILAMGIAAWSFGFRFRPKHAAIATLAAYLFFFVISPFGLALRSNNRGAGLATNLALSGPLLVDVVVNPGKYQKVNTAEEDTTPADKYPTLYFLRRPGTTSNFLERFSLGKLDDEIVADTLKNGTIGWTTISPGIPNILPSVFGVEKSFRSGGNMLIHRANGVIHDEDFVTAISLGIVSDAFSAFGWPGAFLLPLACLAAVAWANSLIIDLRLKKNIYAVSITLGIYLPFSELTISGIIALATYNVAIATLGILIVSRAAKLVDFRYLRPRSARELSDGPVASPQN